MSRGLSKIEDSVTDKLNNMMKTTAFFEQFIQKRFKPMFTRLQQKRWQTKNSSEGRTWDPILPSYALWKKEKYKDSFGHGEQLLIATGRLFKSLTLNEDGDWQQILTGTTLVLNFDVEYASQVSMFRPILEFSSESMKMIRDDLKQWMKKQWQVRT